jgi:membrane fusion protein (multidrug efflux system)
MAVITKEEQEITQSIDARVVEKHPAAKPTVDDSSPTTKKPNKFLSTALATTVGLAVLIGGFFWWQHASSIEETDDAYITGHVHQISSRVAGYVTKVAVDDNDHVNAGQLVVQIDPRDLQLSAESAKAAMLKAQWQSVEARSTTIANARTASSQVYQAESAVASSRAQINKAQETLSDSKLGVILAKTQIEQRQAELTRASADFDRYQTLVQKGAVTKSAYDKARQDKEVAQSSFDGAKATYNQMLVKVKEAEQSLKDTETSAVRAQATQQSAEAAKAQTTVSEDTVAVQKAAADQAKVEYENALTQLSYTRVVAPISGTIGHKTVEVGQQIDRGQALMSIVSDEKWVVANFKETQLGKMHVGQEVDIRVDALAGKHFIGHVQSMSPASGAQFSMLPPDNASGNFTKVVQRIPVKIVFDPASIKGYENALTPGMSVIPEVHLKQ